MSQTGQITKATDAPHPSRAAPLCSTCRHVSPAMPAHDDVVRCNHPAAPVNPIDGRPTVPAMHMRSSHWMNGIEQPVCSEAGLWHEVAP